ncbi:Protein Wnt-9b [Amphibalanus amphitrite]|uniref:Protein Wnt n=1 Tax=Amphibalanus amphitrite TaxID=1232801 RepID=A0A6A4VAP2_AMPAM|nr:Protein Wnt-9b [Amphibalanus amphitrite]
MFHDRWEPGMKEVLLQAVQLSVLSCTEQLADQRWNCSLGASRIRILHKAFKETAFLYAITAAAIAHTTARACAAGHLTACSCDLAYPRGSSPAAERWRWGGCSHNVRFAGQFTRRLLRKRGRSEERRPALLVHKHNWKVGIKALLGEITPRCKCHGVSGTCQLQTCWKQVGPFGRTGAVIKEKYLTAVRSAPQPATDARRPVGDVSVRTNTIISRRRRRGRGRGRRRGRGRGRDRDRRRRRPPSVGPSRKLVYTDKSPSFCERDAYGPGTVGRRCQLGGHCAVLCCGRGYNTQLSSLVTSCNCRVLWEQRSVRVDCQSCTNVTEVYTCK